MPYITQSLLYFILHTKAKYSLVSNSPQILWTQIRHEEKKELILNDWLNPHRVTLLSFLIRKNDTSFKSNKLVCSFYFVDPRWQLTTPTEIDINQTLLSVESFKLEPNLLTFLPNSKTPKPIWWKFIKQNDPSIQHLIVNRIVSSAPFILPYSALTFIPLGLTPPITNLPPQWKEKSSLDPTSKTLFKGGHSLT